MDGKAADVWPLGAAFYTMNMYRNWTSTAIICGEAGGVNAIDRLMNGPPAPQGRHATASAELKDLLIGDCHRSLDALEMICLRLARYSKRHT